MAKDVKDMTMAELEQKRASIISSCSGWLSCQDGSYEMALHYAGIDVVDDAIRARKIEQENAIK